MPAPDHRWRLVTITTHNSWLPGDARGWRSRNHKRHSSGDYKNPPPLEEHAGLRRWVNERAGDAVFIPKNLRCTIGEAIVAATSQLGPRVLAVSVSGQHSHIVVELPDSMKVMKLLIGEVKRASSRAVKKQLPGVIWAAGGDFDPIDSQQHLVAAVKYVLTKQGPGAWTWSHRQDVPLVEVKVRVPKTVEGFMKRPTRGGA